MFFTHTLNPREKIVIWEKKDGAWVRHHTRARTQLFDPTVAKQEEGAPCSEDLEDSRETFMEFTNGAPNQTRRDNWRTEKSLDYGYAFKGKPVFAARTSMELGEEEETQEARKPQGLPLPKQPTPQEKSAS